MALFSQDLFEVFEEKAEPVSLTGKKRKRADEKKEKGSAEGQKKVKSTAGAASNAAGPSTSSKVTDVVDLTVDDEGDGDTVEEMT